MSRYGVFQDGGFYDEVDTWEQAIDLAEELLGGLAQGELSTFTVERAGRLLASVTNRRIEATFHSQFWDPRDEAVDCGSVEVDATAYVLGMPPDAVRALRDNRDSSDAVGLAHVAWRGPFRVTLVDSVRAFFGVTDLAGITDEALAFARLRCSAQVSVERSLRLTFELRLRVMEGADINAFVRSLEVRMDAPAAGVSILGIALVEPH